MSCDDTGKYNNKNIYRRTLYYYYFILTPSPAVVRQKPQIILLLYCLRTGNVPFNPAQVRRRLVGDNFVLALSGGKIRVTSFPCVPTYLLFCIIQRRPELIYIVLSHCFHINVTIVAIIMIILYR